MTQRQLINGFSQLTIQQQIELIQTELRLVGQQLQSIVQPQDGNEHRGDLCEAASMLLADYLEDRELTSFTVLDREPFHAQK